MNKKLIVLMIGMFLILSSGIGFVSAEKMWNFNNHSLNVSNDIYINGGDIIGMGDISLDMGETATDVFSFYDTTDTNEYVQFACRDSDSLSLCQFLNGIYSSSGTNYFTGEIRARGGIADDGGNLVLNDNVDVNGYLNSTDDVCITSGNCLSGMGTGTVTGTGTVNYLTKWSTGGTGIENSIASDDGSTLTVAGDVNVSGGDLIMDMHTGNNGIQFYWNGAAGTKIDDNQIGLESSNIFYINSYAASNGNTFIGKAGSGYTNISGDLVVNGMTGNVGIGTTSPYNLLDVGGLTTSANNGKGKIGIKSDANDLALRIQENSGAEDWSIGVNVTGDLNFYDSSGATPSVTFQDVTGNVGIGTSTPQRELHVNGDILSNATINATGDICITGGNCLSSVSGGSVTGSGTDNYLPRWDAAGTGLEDSIVSDDSSTLNIAGDLAVAGGNLNLDDTANAQNSKIQWAATDGDTGDILYSTNDRWEFNNGGVYFTSSVPTFWNYATTTYMGAASGDNTMFRDNVVSGDDWIINYNAAGNWGIGTTSPGAKLEVNAGDLRLTGTASANRADLRAIDFYNDYSTYDHTAAKIYAERGDGNFQHGRLVFQTANSGILSDNMAIDEDGNVGINTTSPEGALHVTGANVGSATIKGASLGTSGDYSSLELKGTSSSAGGGFIDFGYPNDDYRGRIIYTNSLGRLDFYSNHTFAMTIDKDGNVGIGDSSPDAKLDISNTGSGASFRVDDSTSDTTPFLIDADGKVGIGTASPTYPLTVYSSANDISRAWVESDNSGTSARADVYAAAYTPTGGGTNSLGFVQYGSGTSGTLFGESVAKASLIYSGGADPSKLMIGAGASIPIYFATAGTKRMTISSGGNVGIGDSTPDAPLEVETTASDLKLRLSDDSTSYADFSVSYAGKLTIKTSDSGTTNEDIILGTTSHPNAIVIDESSTSVGINSATASGTYELDVNGDIQADAFYYSSDERLKENVIIINNSLERIRQLEGIEFDWKKSGKRSIGVIAQNVEKVFPELVETDDNGYKSVQYGNLVAPLIESVKTLADQNDAQQEEIDRLKKEMDLLKSEIQSIKRE